MLFKLHLYTYLVLLTLPFFIKSIFCDLFAPFKTSWLISIVCLFYTIIYGYITAGTSGLAYSIDTLLIPLLIFPVVISFSSTVKLFALKIIFFALSFNSLAAIFEYISGSNIFMPYVEDGLMYYFRANGFLSHPLNNALITASIVPILFGVSVLRTYFIVFLTILGLLSFGARTATMLFILASTTYFVYSYSRFKNGVIILTDLEKNISILSLLLGFVFVFFAIIKFDIGARVFENLMIDGSAQTRFDVYRVFSYLSITELFFGASSELFDNIELYVDNLIIENFVINWILKYGIVGSIFLIISFYFFLFKLYSLGTFTQKISVILFALISVSNNSLSTKTAAFLLFLISYALLVRKNNNV